MAGRFSVEAVFKAIDKMTAPIAAMQSKMERFTKSAEKGIKDLDAAADRWFAGMKKAGIGVAAGVTAAGAAFGVAVKPGMEFEQQMANLAATSLKTRGEIAALEKEAKRLGAATQYSATEVAAAMEEMSKSGFSESQILSGISGMIYAASASGEDLATTTASVSSVMKGMGISLDQTSRVSDVLAKASVETASSIGSLAESMSKVAPTARQFGVPLEDTVTMVALLQDVGLDASEAGSAVATMLTQLATPTDQMKAKMASLGVSFKDATGDMKSPVGVLLEFMKASQKAGGNMEQAAFFAELVGMRGQRAALNLKDALAKTEGGYLDLRGKIENAAGTAERMTALRMDTLTGDVDKMTESVKTLAIELYSTEGGPLRGIVQGITNWVDANADVIKGGFTDFLNTVRDNFGTIVTALERLGRAAAVITVAMTLTKLWAGAVWLLNAAVTANPLTIWLVAITAALALIYAFWPEITAFFGWIWDTVAGLASAVGSAIAGALGAVWNVIKSALTAYFEFVVGFWTLIGMAIYSVLRPYLELIVEVFSAVWAKVVEIWQPIGEFFSGLWAGVVEVATAVFDRIAEVVGVVVDKVKAVWSTLTGFFQALFAGIVALYDNTLGPVINGVGEIIGFVRDVGADVMGTDGTSTGGTPQVVSPQERVARSISESTHTTNAEVTIRDKTGRAEVTRKPTGGVGLKVARSGAL